MAKQRKGLNHTATFEERLAEEAFKLRAAAEKQPPGSMARELLLRRARQAETASHQRMASISRTTAAHGSRTFRLRSEEIKLKSPWPKIAG